MVQPARIKIARLKKRPEFLRVAKGAKAAMPGLVLQARKRTEPEAGDTACRIGFTATRKIGNAVVRNRAKRRLRALAAGLLPRHGQAGYDYVLIGRMETATRTFDALTDDLQKAFVRVHKQ